MYNILGQNGRGDAGHRKIYIVCHVVQVPPDLEDRVAAVQAAVSFQDDRSAMLKECLPVAEEMRTKVSPLAPKIRSVS